MKAMTSPWLFLLAGAALATPTVRADDDNWTRNFRVGMQIGLNIHADFKTAGQFGISGSAPGPGVGVTGANHVYDDGYVRVDATGDAAPAGFPPSTSFWGYSKASQLSGQTLTFHAANSVSIAGAANRSDDAPYLGFDMAYGGTIGYWGWPQARVGWEFGFGFLPITISDTRTLSGTFTRTVDQFSTGGIIVPQEGYQGGPSGIGPTIPDAVTSRSQDTVSGLITGSRTLDVTLYNIRLGPTLYWNLGHRWGVSASAGPAVGLVSGDYQFNETGLLANGETAHNTGKFGKTDLVYGGYANALGLFRLEKGGDLFAGVQFISLSGATFSNGGREAKLNMPASIAFTFGINWPF